ncbi:LOB domain-containing protein 30-like [Miscanthus floridulus]|uniref:LOB domain-containing protein 30-like n=1 Tax=Miscanthus floridulus TaxID=154761 RepID=UPI003459A94E
MSSSVHLGASAGGSGGSSGVPSGGVGGGGGGPPCGACKFLRRKCVTGCIFAPYFDSEQGAAHFAAVHKVFGAANVSKLLLQIPPHKRLDAVVTVCYEAQARIRDPVYGCVSHVFALQQQVVNLQTELTYLQGHLSTMELPTPPPFAQQNQMPMTAAFCVSNQPSASNNIIPATVDVSTFFEPQTQQSQWVSQQQQVQQHQLNQQQYVTVGEGPGTGVSGSGATGGGDLLLLAREILDRHGTAAVGSQSQPEPPCTQ